MRRRSRSEDLETRRARVRRTKDRNERLRMHRALRDFLAEPPPRTLRAEIFEAVRMFRPWRPLHQLVWAAFFGLVAVALGVLFWVFFPWRLGEMLRLDLSETALTMGQVVELREQHTAYRDVHFTYRVPGDDELLAGSCYLKPRWLTIGEPCRVEYVVARPSIACIREGRLARFGYWGLLSLLAGALSIALLGTILHTVFVTPLRIRRLLRLGVHATGRTECERKVSTTDGGAPLIRYTVRCVFEADGETVRVIGKLGSRESTSEPIEVLHDRDRPEVFLYFYRHPDHPPAT